MDSMQVCWSDIDRTHRHATYSGHRTVCDLPVIEARPIYDSSLTDLTCPVCTQHVLHNLAREAAERYLNDRAAEIDGRRGLTEFAKQAVVPQALRRRRADDS
ncbi:hypothetical protein ACW9HR_22370 [Nocardia gipuzkoensis]